MDNQNQYTHFVIVTENGDWMPATQERVEGELVKPYDGHDKFTHCLDLTEIFELGVDSPYFKAEYFSAAWGVRMEPFFF